MHVVFHYCRHDGNHQSHLNRSYSSDLDTVERSTFTVKGEGNNALQGCNYIQLVLEEVPKNRVDGQAEAGDDELKFTPVLVWKPAAVCQQDMKQFETPFECNSSRNGKRKERKVAMGTTDLTESLPSELVVNNEVCSAFIHTSFLLLFCSNLATIPSFSSSHSLSLLPRLFFVYNNFADMHARIQQ